MAKYDRDGLLAQLYSVMYKMRSIMCAGLLGMEPTLDRSGLVFMVLFEGCAPLPPHLDFFTIDLSTIQPSPVRIELTLTAAELAAIRSGSARCSFGVTPVMDAHNTDYVVAAVCGRLHTFCLTSGAEIPPASPQAANLPSADASIAVIPNSHNAYDVAVFGPRLSKPYVLSHLDLNSRSAVDRMEAALTPDKLTRAAHRNCAVSKDLPFIGCLADGTDGRSISGWLRTAILRMADVAVARVLKYDERAPESEYEPSRAGTPSTEADGLLGDIMRGIAFGGAAGGGNDVGALGL